MKLFAASGSDGQTDGKQDDLEGRPSTGRTAQTFSAEENEERKEAEDGKGKEEKRGEKEKKEEEEEAKVESCFETRVCNQYQHFHRSSFFRSFSLFCFCSALSISAAVFALDFSSALAPVLDILDILLARTTGPPMGFSQPVYVRSRGTALNDNVYF